MSIEELEALCVVAALEKIGNRQLEFGVDTKIVKNNTEKPSNLKQNVKCSAEKNSS